MARFSDDRVRSILLGTRSFETYTLPGRDDVVVAIRALSEAELDDCRVAGQSEMRALAKRKGWKPESFVNVDPESIERCIERQMIFRSFYDAETIHEEHPVRFFDKPADVAQLDAWQVTAYSSLYVEHQRWCAPLGELNEEGVEELIDALGKPESVRVRLASYAPSTLVSLCISLALRLRGETSPTSKSSSGHNADGDDSSNDDGSGTKK